ncbi:MAG: alternative ribosome rescue aminoacyl-tRNA hydrolase ArfB [Acidimicrobiales bacterium]
MTAARSATSTPSEVLRVTRNLAIPLEELQWRFTTSGGPGGQHANRSSTRVEVRFDVEGSASLGPRQRARLLERLGPTVRAVSGEQRSQARNREIALHRLADRLASALRVQHARIPTAPSAAARVRRLEEKRRRSVRKRERAANRDGWD